MVNFPRQNDPYTTGSERLNNKNKQTISDFLENTNNFMSKLRSRNISPGAEPSSANNATARFRPTSDQGSDWRVKVSLPNVSTFRSSPLLQPLSITDNCVVFPITPTITLVHTANYDDMNLVHSNYPFPQYSNSRVDDITIAGDFPVQNEDDARYWVAAVHFFRSVTKMAYGETSNKGAPPPICKLNGYGDFVLNNLSIVVTSFTVGLEPNVNYIRTNINANDGDYDGKYSMVPTNSLLTITCKPIFSRSKVETFSLDSFVNGDLYDKGFI